MTVSHDRWLAVPGRVHSMVSLMRVLGIDFGTSNTVSMLRMPDGRLRPLLFDGGTLMPTAVYLTPEGQLLKALARIWPS